MLGIFCINKRKQSLMYISHLFEDVCYGGFGVGLVFFIKLLCIKSLNCLIKDNICLRSSPSPSIHKGSGQVHSLAGKMHFPSDKLLCFSFLLHMNADDVWAVLHVVFTPCSLSIVSRMNFVFPHACLFLLESVGFLLHCQGTIGNIQVPRGMSWISLKFSC